MTSTPHNPDDRDLLDFADAVAVGKNPQPLNDMERTYLHVQNALQGESAAIPPDLKQSTWEDVMSTLALAPERPVSNRTRRQQSPVSPRRIPTRRRMQWTPMASIAAAVLVVLASVGIWRINTMPEDSLPPLAPQVAGIVSGDDISMVAATPEATAVEDVNGHRSIPIILHVNEQPMDGPVIWLTTSGEVKYDDGAGVTLISTGATQVNPVTNNVILVIADAPEKDSKDKNGKLIHGSTWTYHNLVTGEVLAAQAGSAGGGPLTVATLEESPMELSVINFDTMESKTLAELTGGQFPVSVDTSVSVSDDLSTIAVATSQYESEGSAILLRQSGLPGEIAVIPADLSGVTWVEVPESMPPVGNFSLSPDGTKLAFISADLFRGGSNMTIAVVDIPTGEQLVRTQRLESSTFSHFQWVSDSNGFVIVSDKSVQLYALDDQVAAEPSIIYETEGGLMLMPQFEQSELLHLLDSSEDLSTTRTQPDTSKFVILNTTSQETISVEGEPWFPGFMFPEQMTRSLAPIPISQDGKTAVLVHPITGEEFPDLIADVYDPLMDPNFEPIDGQGIPVANPVVTAQGSNVSVVTLVDGNLAVFETTEDTFDARVIERPDGTEEEQIMLSPAGDFLTIGSAWESQTEGSTFLMLDLTDPDAAWVQGEPGQMLAFVEYQEMEP